MSARSCSHRFKTSFGTFLTFWPAMARLYQSLGMAARCMEVARMKWPERTIWACAIVGGPAPRLRRWIGDGGLFIPSVQVRVGPPAPSNPHNANNVYGFRGLGVLAQGLGICSDSLGEDAQARKRPLPVLVIPQFGALESVLDFVFRNSDWVAAMPHRVGACGYVQSRSPCALANPRVKLGRNWLRGHSCSCSSSGKPWPDSGSGVSL